MSSSSEAPYLLQEQHVPEHSAMDAIVTWVLLNPTEFLIGCGAILLPLLLLAGCSAIFLIRNIDQQEAERQAEREEQKQMREEQKNKEKENKRAVAAAAATRIPATAAADRDGLTQRTKAAGGKK